MKTTKYVLIAAVLIFALISAGCAPKDAPPPTLTPSDGSAQTDGAVAQPTPSKEDELLAFDEPHIEAADYELEKLLALVRPFNVCPEEFTDPARLSDAALFFAAVTQLNGSFEPLEDGYTYALPNIELAPAIRQIFGPDAALSEGWESGEYEPYAVDAAGERIIKYSLGQITGLYYPYACVKTDGGWELWLLDLYDPLFSNANPVALESGDASAVKWDMVAPYAADMQTGIYTVKTSAGGDYYLAGFRFRNFKGVEHHTY